MGPTVAIVGRPNVGKSTLFNRLTGRKSAIVDDTPGVTRDRREGHGELLGHSFTLVDTAGYEEAEGDDLTARIQQQTRRAIALADVLLFLVDGRTGILPLDRTVAGELRRTGKPVILAVNKSEGRDAESRLSEAWTLGFGEPIALSAEHALGLVELAEALRVALPAPPDNAQNPDGGEPAEPVDWSAARPLKVAVIGRPNAGKSTLINALIGEERLITGPEAGITRDAISIPWSWRGKPVELFDTAGLRKKARVVDKVEKLSAADTLRAVQFAEVVVVVIDALLPFEAQDLQIADLVAQEGRAIVLAVNKWDKVDDRPAALRVLQEKCERLLPQIRGVAMPLVSAKTGQGLDRLMEAVESAYAVWNKRVSTADLNRWLQEAMQRHTPPAVSGRRIKLRYATQAKSRPPTFALFGNQLKALPESYLRYLTNGLREAFGLPGAPIRFHLRQSKNPYTED